MSGERYRLTWASSYGFILWYYILLLL